MFVICGTAENVSKNADQLVDLLFDLKNSIKRHNEQWLRRELRMLLGFATEEE